MTGQGMTDQADAIVVPGADNFRDIGGLPAASGQTRVGVLFRSGHLARLGDEGREAMRRLGIRRIVDLRADDEVVRERSRTEGLGIETVRVPLFLGSTASFFVNDTSLVQLYRGLVDGAADRIVEAIRAALGQTPVLVHCTAGKDRTGVTVALMLAAAGVEREAVVADYALTERLLPAERNVRSLEELRRLHPEAHHLEDLVTRSPAPVLRELLADIDARYGSAAGFLGAHGMDDDELPRLRDALIEG
ncbi:MAG: tyrosine-protein phosphatase [Microbacterium sp.]